MLTLRRADDRGAANFGWLDSRHTFSFGGYYDPNHMGFRSLRVINDDHVVPGAGFGTHGHRDMEIISYVVDGTIAHKDSIGNVEHVPAGDVQRMTAGTGIQHSEFNPSKEEGLHFLQMWVIPERRGIEPGYEQKNFPLEERRGRFRTLVSRDGEDGSLRIHQDVRLLGTLLGDGEKATLELAHGRHAWVHVVRGSARIGDLRVSGGDGVQVSDETRLEFEGIEDAEIIVFDLA